MAESQVKKASKTEDSKPIRVPLHEQKSMLETVVRKGYKRRWVKDVGVRIEQFKLAGYQIVKQRGLLIGDSKVNFSLGEGYRVYGGSDNTGKQFNLVLMEISQVLYNTDQKAKQERINEGEKAILGKGDEEGFYKKKAHTTETIHGVGLNRRKPK